MLDTSIWEPFEAVARRVGARIAIVQDDQEMTFDELRAEALQLASALARCGATHDADVTDGPSTVSQPTVAILSNDRPAMVATLAAVYRARAIPVTINFRYQADEIARALEQTQPVVVFTDAERLPVLKDALRQVEMDPPVICYDQGADGATTYAAFVASGSEMELSDPTGDDRCLLLTGGTSGTPKGVIWRQADVLMLAMGGVDAETGLEHESIESFVQLADRGCDAVMSLPPLMHPYGQWIVFRGLIQGDTTILASAQPSFDAGRALRLSAKWKAKELVIAGDAFALPLLEAMKESGISLPALRLIRTGSVGMSAGVKRRLHSAFPKVAIAEVVGGTEQAGMLVAMSTAGDDVREQKVFLPFPGTVLVGEDRERIIPPGHPEIGLLARTGRHPLGYLNNPDASSALFEDYVGTRYLLTGDRACWTRDGGVELIGRGSQVINTGGEKVSSEEVDTVLLRHPAVQDALTCGIPHERWGTQVASAVELVPGASISAADLIAFARSHLSPYKVPGQIVLVPKIRRSPVGKADYAWALRTVAQAAQESAIT